jgi:hypothetical protein
MIRGDHNYPRYLWQLIGSRFGDGLGRSGRRGFQSRLFPRVLGREGTIFPEAESANPLPCEAFSRSSPPEGAHCRFCRIEQRRKGVVHDQTIFLVRLRDCRIRLLVACVRSFPSEQGKR